MRRVWTWLLYRLGLRKPPPFSQIVLDTLRKNPDTIHNELVRNALFRPRRSNPLDGTRLWDKS